MRICVVGNPENRRVVDFRSQAIQAGFPEPACLSWLEVIDNPHSVSELSDFDLVRIESPGENDTVQHRLIALGGEPNASIDFGEIALLKESHHGFCRVLERLSAVNVSYQNRPHDIVLMFDKWQSHVRFLEAGLPRPETKLVPFSVKLFRDFRQQFEHASGASGRLFLKPRYGSSASGVCAYRWSRDREQLIAPIEIDRRLNRTKLFNSLRMRTYTSIQDIDTILSVLLPQEMVCERWIHKARLLDGRFDLRILVVGGESRHCVVRQSHHPMTNLHLGNQRGDMNQLLEIHGEATIIESRSVAERAAACFPESLYAGVDVIVDSKRNPYVCEVNAFGDLLPNLLHRGEATYEAILRVSANLCRL